MDFTLKTYRSLLDSLQKNAYSFLPFYNYILTTDKPTGQAGQELSTTTQSIILRHDVDDLKLNSLRFAQIENDFGIKGTYYFRIVPQSFDEKVIEEITTLGHEIGYHYEDIDLVYNNNLITKSSNHQITNDDLIEAAYKSFCKNLEMFRKNFDIKTICMHGSPRSKYDNKLLWQKYNYRDLGIIGEPYLDIDFNEVFYLTDTGRRWDGYKVSIRDKVSDQQKKWDEKGLVFHSTRDILNAIKESRLPDKIMMTFHPQRWNNKPFPWLKELVLQETKNVIKRIILKRRM